MTTAMLDTEAAHAAGLTLIGEPLAIDLVNTAKLAHDPPVDLLPDDHANSVFWQLEASRLPNGWQVPALADARELRAAIRNLLESRILGDSPDLSALQTVNRYAAAASSSPRLSADWKNEADLHATEGATALLGAVAHSAIDVLTAATADRLRRCAADDCSMLFVATNAKRQWCTAAGCGNRERVARHALRQRNPESTSV